MKCSRPKCANVAALRHSGLCEGHYKASPHGYVPAEPVQKRYAALRAAGLSCRRIADLSGVHRDTLRALGSWSPHGRVELATHAGVMSVAVPRRVVDGGAAQVCAVGTHRRVQALMVLGWRQADIGHLLGITPQSVSGYLANSVVTAATAARVADVFERLQLTRGPSEHTAARACAKGWHPPLTWDEETIDDPSAQPDYGEKIHTTASERIAELGDLGVFNVNHIAERLGIQPNSVKQQLLRSAA